jgi:hypothetical protein
MKYYQDNKIMSSDKRTVQRYEVYTNLRRKT